MEYQKPKSAAKDVTVKGPKLESLVLSTMKTISTIVGSTLGPGGQPVLIERFEHGMAPMVTKDGVTVFRSLGFDNPSSHVIMEAARDAAVRTANEAGDGTTTATVLAESIVRLTHAFCKENPKFSPQKVVRRLESVFRTVIQPAIQDDSFKVDSTTDDGKKLLRGVAKISANGDDALADVVMECFDLVGDEGNVTITEVSGPSHYEVERIDGFPIETGYEDSCGKFYPKFINDPGTQRCVLENPVFILFHGRITEIQTIIAICSAIGIMWQQGKYDKHNVVIFATGFSETVLGHLAFNFVSPDSINIFPMLVPKSPLTNGQLQFLQDLAAVTGAVIFDPINKPLEAFSLDDHELKGKADIIAELSGCLGPGLRQFEASRFRATIVGHATGECETETGEVTTFEDQLIKRADEIKQLMENPESALDKILLQERLGKLTNGIAKLKVVGSSNGELREKRDRAEDAVCAVRGAIKHGVLPGGGWTLLKLNMTLSEGYPDDEVVTRVLCPALLAPISLLYRNCGFNDEEIEEALKPVRKSIQKPSKTSGLLVYDALEGKYVNPYQEGILDSTPAVLEAIRNSLSIASLLGTLGGICVFQRDHELDRSEAKETQNFMRDANVEGEADSRP